MKTARCAMWLSRRSQPSGRRAPMTSAQAFSPSRPITAEKMTATMKGRRTEEIRHRPFNVVLRLKELFCGSRQRRGKRDAAEAVNAAQVIGRPLLIDDAFVA